MQLPCSWRATGLDAVCGTYSDFTFYKQTRSTFAFSLPALDATTDDTPCRQRGTRAASSLRHRATEPRGPRQWGPGLVSGPVGPRGVPRRPTRARGAPTRPRGSPTRAQDAAASADPRVSLGPWQLCPGAGEGLGGQPSPGRSRGRGTCQEKTQPPGWRNQGWTRRTEPGERR